MVEYLRTARSLQWTEMLPGKPLGIYSKSDWPMRH